jgi:hypothetical protein
MFQRNKSLSSVGLKKKQSNKQQVASSAYTLTWKWQAVSKLHAVTTTTTKKHTLSSQCRETSNPI